MIGVYYLHLFACNMLVGRIGGFLESMPARSSGCSTPGWSARPGLGLLIVRSSAGRILAPTEADIAGGDAEIAGTAAVSEQPADSSRV